MFAISLTVSHRSLMITSDESEESFYSASWVAILSANLFPFLLKIFDAIYSQAAFSRNDTVDRVERNFSIVCVFWGCHLTLHTVIRDILVGRNVVRRRHFSNV